MYTNRVTSIGEATIRFFSYFTILTNSLVAFYFSYISLSKKTENTDLKQLTAITVYITVVGLVYQLLLRHTWSPTGTQKIVDELLHSINPVLVILFWFIKRKEGQLNYKNLLIWLVYPLIYLFYVLIRGSFSGFYPYPFIDASILGTTAIMLNSFGITFLFVITSLIFIWLNRRTR